MQPTILGDSDVLYGTSDGGTWRLRLKHESPGSEWSVEEVWLSKAIKPYFNDMVVHKDHIYGFDGNSTIFFVCVSLADGKLMWKERGYGGGQVLLLPDQDLLLILSEKNKIAAEKIEVALVEANPADARNCAGCPCSRE